MKILVYSLATDKTIANQLGRADYSYYYVRKQFEPELAKLGKVIVIEQPEIEVDLIADGCRQTGERCIFLSFTPPHKTWISEKCITVPVFAWEYGTLPNEPWNGDERNDWAGMLKRCGAAITHSLFACDVTRKAVGEDFNIISVPAPLWDGMQAGITAPIVPDVVRTFSFSGVVYDSRTAPPSIDPAEREQLVQSITAEQAGHSLELSGVIYTAIFNPNDGRKNWPDLVHAFCWTFRGTDNATLLIKLTHHDPAFSMRILLQELAKMPAFSARVILIHGYLNSDELKQFISCAHYAVNSSFGEGQCLPLMEFMASGRPIVAPLHTAMLDYLNEENGFPVRSFKEWWHWAHDPRSVKRTYRYRIEWQSLADAFCDSHRVASELWPRYLAMAEAARLSSQKHCSSERALSALKDFLETLPTPQQIHQTVPNRVESPGGALNPALTGRMLLLRLVGRVIRLYHRLRSRNW
ncbi:MAG: glycosyltransferase family 1 protein [Hahellaceae bacterium]|nr:glycosyltransferase family 1 protein [Hahellaceae bacterium]